MMNKNRTFAMFTIIAFMMSALIFSASGQNEKKNTGPGFEEDNPEAAAKLTPEMRELRKQFRQRYLESFEKDGIGKPESIQKYIDTAKQQAILDKKIWVFDVKGTFSEGKVILNGEVSAPPFKTCFLRVFQMLGFEKVENNIKVLPDDTLTTASCYGFVNTTAAWMYREANEKSEPLNQVFYGEAIRLLKSSEDKKFYLIQSPDTYIGYIKAEEIIASDIRVYAEFQKKDKHAQFLVNTSIRTSDKEKRAIQISTNTVLAVKSVDEKAKKVSLYLPDGKTGEASLDDVRIINPDIKASREHLDKLSNEVMASPYKWGGTGKEGIDCSGFSQYLYRRVGINLMRDADEQGSLGKIVAYKDSLNGLLPGDLLFFMGKNGKISHVAVSLGGLDFVHASSPEVQYASLDPKSKIYNEKCATTLCFAKRIFTAGFPVDNPEK